MQIDRKKEQQVVGKALKCAQERPKHQAIVYHGLTTMTPEVLGDTSQRTRAAVKEAQQAPRILEERQEQKPIRKSQRARKTTHR